MTKANPNHPPPINPEDVRRLASQGMIALDIADALGCSRSTVDKIAANNHFTLPTLPCYNSTPSSEFWLLNDPELRLRRSLNEPFSQIAAALGVTKNAAIGRARRIGLIKSPSVVPSPVIELPPLGCCLWSNQNPGDEGFHWCGEPVTGKSSFCSKHAVFVYISTKKDDTATVSL